MLDQITQFTGRRYLGDYADGVAQYRALLDGAPPLSVGKAKLLENSDVLISSWCLHRTHP